jgi:hypothetical protein
MIGQLFDTITAFGNAICIYKINEPRGTVNTGVGVSFDANAGSTDVVITRNGHNLKLGYWIRVEGTDNVNRLPNDDYKVKKVTGANTFVVTGLADASGGTCNYYRLMLDYSGNGNHIRTTQGNDWAEAQMPTGDMVADVNGDLQCNIFTDWNAFNFDKFSWGAIYKVPLSAWTDGVTRFIFSITDNANNSMLFQKTVNNDQIQWRWRCAATDRNCTISTYNPVNWCVVGGTVDLFAATNLVSLYAYDDGTWKSNTTARTNISWGGDNTVSGALFPSGQGWIGATGYVWFMPDVVIPQSGYEHIQEVLNL